MMMRIKVGVDENVGGEKWNNKVLDDGFRSDEVVLGEGTRD